MLYNLKIRVAEKPWLGQQKTNQIRKFRRDKKNRIVIDSVMWQWALASAAKALEYDHVNVETIRTESGFEAPNITLYNRRYHHNGKPHEEMFEAIREGVVLTIPILVMESNEVEGRQFTAPTHAELTHIFDYVGRFIGLSPWGARWGFGRYDMIEVEQLRVKEINEKTPKGRKEKRDEQK